MHKDLIGKKFGRLTVIEFSHVDKKDDYRTYWKCQCFCGKILIVRSPSLNQGLTKSCGCLHSERARIQQKKMCFRHGMSGTRLHIIWRGIRQRCHNKNSPAFPSYGGKGITVCTRWKKFENFLKDMGQPPSSKYSIDRIDNEGDYSKKNCRWATAKEQANNRRSCHVIEYENKRMNLKQWAKEKKIPYKTLHNRLGKLGWSIEEALNKPMRSARSAAPST